MKIYRDLNQLAKDLRDHSIALTIGNFDGVHRGHQFLLKNFMEYSNQRGLTPVVLSFSPHPLVFLKNKKNYLINSEKIKEKQLRSQNIPYLIELVFDQNLATKSGAEFIRMLVEKLPTIKCFYLGHDFSLGANKSFTSQIMVSEFQAQFDIKLEREFSVGHKTVSSSVIRDLLKKGEIVKCNKLLARPFRIEGKVVHGNKIGRQLGFATLNINYEDCILLPRSGVYFGRVIINKKAYCCAINLGVRPSVTKDLHYSLEAHLFDFNDEVYGVDVEVEFLKYIRDEKKFNSKELLKEQISQDITVMKTYKCQISMGLIGKNIQHSQSPMIYQTLLDGGALEYSFFDFEDEKQIVDLKSLLKTTPYLSVTSPYKQYCFKRCQSVGLDQIQAVNALKLVDDQVIGTNTDLEACDEILCDYLDQKYNDFILLGDGAMARVFVTLFRKYNCQFIQLSRKLQNLEKLEREVKKHNQSKKLLVINACGRGFIYPDIEATGYTVWDLNYFMPLHQKLFYTKNVKYIDGLQLLERQAMKALSFWNLKTS